MSGPAGGRSGWSRGPGTTRNSEGAVVKLSDGRLMLIYSRFSAERGDDHDPAELAGRFSADGRFTSSEREQIVRDNEAGLNVMSVSLLRLDHGDVLLFYLLKNELSNCKPVVRQSSDDSPTWSDAVDMVADDDGYLIHIAAAPTSSPGPVDLVPQISSPNQAIGHSTGRWR